MGGFFQVDPADLRRAAAAARRIAGDVARAPGTLAQAVSAAGAVPGSQTAAALQGLGAAWDAGLRILIDGLNGFGTQLDAAASTYQESDATAQARISQAGTALGLPPLWGR